MRPIKLPDRQRAFLGVCQRMLEIVARQCCLGLAVVRSIYGVGVSVSLTEHVTRNENDETRYTYLGHQP